MPVLTGIDVLGIQRYVFASSRLRDALAASWLVHRATSGDGELEQSGGDVVLDSGGNATIIFPSEAPARDFAAKYTRRLHESAPGLEVVVAHRSYAPGGLAEALGRLQIDLACTKIERIPSAPQLGLSVTASCRITGLPAIGLDPQEPGLPLSRMVLRWRDSDVRRESLAQRWDWFLPSLRERDHEFPDVIDDMGRTFGDTSLIGIVHIDGNGIGQQIEEWRRRCVGSSLPDDAVHSELRDWSRRLDKAGRDVLKTVVERVRGAVQSDQNGPQMTGGVADLAFNLKRGQTGRILLPLRPVLLGGDDLTFLCDGRIALDLAETALDAFSVEIPHLGRISACAGVALVPAHTPFDRAYELADALCGSAKRRRRERTDTGSWIDWHIGAPHPGEGIGGLRARSYQHRSKLQLTCRPYRLGAKAGERETWRWLSQTVLGTTSNGFRGELWSQHRNKLKSLAQIVREGPDGVKRARSTWTAAAGLTWPEDLGDTGFFDGIRTPLLDAAELLDLHLPLARESSP
ncbi:MAG: hypothetical protein KF773_10675 [Deltaproteobacteria bacterium]|nr:hypothetical protein [Deltaproteobacteria bacterium]